MNTHRSYTTTLSFSYNVRPADDDDDDDVDDDVDDPDPPFDTMIIAQRTENEGGRSASDETRWKEVVRGRINQAEVHPDRDHVAIQETIYVA